MTGRERQKRFAGAWSATALALGMACTIAPAVSASAPAGKVAIDDGTIRLRCGTVWDAADGRRQGPVAISVRSGKIVSVVRDSGALHPGEFDLRTATCLPGLIDAHTLVALESDRLEGDYDHQLLKLSHEYRSIMAANHARSMISWGFTSIRDLGSEGAGASDVAVRDAINNGIIPGPRMQVATQAIVATSAYPLLGYAVNVPRGADEVTGADEGRRVVRQQVARGADVIKLYADRSPRRGPNGTLLTIPTLTVEELTAMIDEAHRQQRKVAVHSRAAESARTAIASGADSIEHGDYLDDDNLRAMAQNKVFYVPDFDTDPRVAATRVNAGADIWGYIPEVKCKTLSRAVKAGVPIAFGSGIGGADWQYKAGGAFRPMAACGMTAEQILVSATADAAKLMGWDDRLGTLEPGKLADIIAVPGDPLRDIAQLENIIFVAKGGVVLKHIAGRETGSAGTE
jgi:imidazolonepropionase-like amidohydrolase